MDPDPNFDSDPKLFLCFFNENKTLLFFNKKLSPGSGSANFFHTLDPDLHQQIFQTLDPDPNEMDADPKPCVGIIIFSFIQILSVHK